MPRTRQRTDYRTYAQHIVVSREALVDMGVGVPTFTSSIAEELEPVLRRVAESQTAWASQYENLVMPTTSTVIDSMLSNVSIQWNSLGVPYPGIGDPRYDEDARQQLAAHVPVSPEEGINLLIYFERDKAIQEEVREMS